MPSAIALPLIAAFISSGSHLSRDLILHQAFQEMLKSLPQCGGNELPDFLLDILFDFGYSLSGGRLWRLHWGCTSFLGFVLFYQKGYIPYSFSATYCT